MKKLLLILAVAAIAFSFTYSNNNDLDKWLGKWVTDYEGGKFYENWEKKSDDLYEATGHLVIEGDTVFRELLRVEKFGNHWAYIAVINGGKPVMFPLKSNDSDKWVFENKEHDFPQRVTYHLQDNGTLYAVVDGKMKGKEMKEEYFYKRVN